MPKASRKELRKSLFKKGAGAREEAKVEAKAAAPVKKEEPKAPVRHAPKRYILFVGNLPYNCPEESIKTHFKASTPSKVRVRSNGICFLEFEGENSAARLHRALQFHHSDFEGRRINVELSAGGGGNNKNRREKIRLKNDDFQNEMTKKEKEKTEAAAKASKKKTFK